MDIVASHQTQELGRLQPIGWVGLVFFAGSALIAWRAGQAGAALAFTPFIALSCFLLVTRATLVFDTKGVTRRTPFATHRMESDEIRRGRVETDGVTLLLSGDTKRLPIAPRFWAGATRKAAVAFVEQQLAA